MPNKLDELVKAVYRKWMAQEQKETGAHPDEETFACFFEGKLSVQEECNVKEHLRRCKSCLDLVMLQARLSGVDEVAAPQEAVDRAKKITPDTQSSSILEIFLKFKEKTIEMVNTSGDILLGQEVVPAAVLRARKVNEFQESVTIFKDFHDFRVELKIENKGNNYFSLSAVIKEIPTQKVIKDLRVTLIKDDVELESYLSGLGKVIFDHVLLGKYTVTISNIESRLASIVVDISV